MNFAASKAGWIRSRIRPSSAAPRCRPQNLLAARRKSSSLDTSLRARHSFESLMVQCAVKGGSFLPPGTLVQPRVAKPSGTPQYRRPKSSLNLKIDGSIASRCYIQSRSSRHSQLPAFATAGARRRKTLSAERHRTMTQNLAIRASSVGRRRPARSSRRRTRDSARCGGRIRCTSRRDDCRAAPCLSPGRALPGSDRAWPRRGDDRGSGSAGLTVRSRRVSASTYSNTCTGELPESSRSG